MSKSTAALIAIVAIAMIAASESEAIKLRPARFYDDGPVGPYPVEPYPAATGERAIVRVRGVRHPYDGSAPSKIAIEDEPYRGPYPRGVYDRLDSPYGRGNMRGPMYPRGNIGGYVHGGGYGSNYGSGYGSGYGFGYGSGYGSSMYGAPNRIAVTGAYPYGYGSRYA